MENGGTVLIFLYLAMRLRLVDGFYFSLARALLR
jgi:hypothetical protein